LQVAFNFVLIKKIAPIQELHRDARDNGGTREKEVWQGEKGAGGTVERENREQKLYRGENRRRRRDRSSGDPNVLWSAERTGGNYSEKDKKGSHEKGRSETSGA